MGILVGILVKGKKAVPRANDYSTYATGFRGHREDTEQRGERMTEEPNEVAQSRIDVCYAKGVGRRSRVTASNLDALVCTNPEDREELIDALGAGATFRSIRRRMGYAGAFKKIQGEKHDGIYCTDQADALKLHLGLMEHWPAHEIITESLGFTPYSWTKVAHGKTIQEVWNNPVFDVIVTPDFDAAPSNRRQIYLRQKDGEPVDTNRIYNWINDREQRPYAEIPSSCRKHS